MHCQEIKNGKNSGNSKIFLMPRIRKILELVVLRGDLFDLENQGLFSFESRKVLGNTGFLSSYYF